MWAIAVAVFALCKVLTWRAGRQPASLGRNIAYFIVWPGLDAKAFLGPANAKAPKSGEWVFAAFKLAFGAMVLWEVATEVLSPLVRGWVGMLGLVFLLHFGAFHLLSCAWRAAGVQAKPLMNWPIAATSLGDFWGRRWNTAFRDLTFHLLFRPLARSLGARVGLAAGFLFSGLVHDLVISVPAGGGYGWPTLYFTIQGLGLLAERKMKLSETANRLFAAVVLVAPAAGLFHEPFILNVIVPFLDVIGA
jgi:D-alanyl-lipoteichoic acid acyltransferase DltB (MBOAT superfamily)